MFYQRPDIKVNGSITTQLSCREDDASGPMCNFRFADDMEVISKNWMLLLIAPGGSLEYFVYVGVHSIILGKKLLCYPILMGS